MKGLTFVTGAAGFIGARFVESCNRRQLKIISVDRVEHFEDRPEHRGLDFGERVDISESLNYLKDHRAEITQIVHLGAISQTTIRDENSVRAHNTDYSRALWSLATAYKIPFVYASSASTYGDGSAGFDDEEALLPKLVPQSAYARSKHEFDLWVMEQTSTPPAWSGFKFFNVYGFGERHKVGMWSIVLNSFEQIQKTGKVKLFRSHHPDYADGGQLRDFIYVEDVIRVLWFAIEKPIVRGVFNLGTGSAHSFLEMTQAVFRAMGKPEQIEFIPMPDELKAQYQYFTEARMERLRAEGYQEAFHSPDDAVKDYLRRLQS